MSTRTRIIRYGAPILTIIVGVLFAAVETNRLGNTVQTVATAGGLIWFIAIVGHDMGMGLSTERRRIPAVPPPPAGDEDAGASARAKRDRRPTGGQPPVSPS